MGLGKGSEVGLKLGTPEAKLRYMMACCQRGYLTQFSLIVLLFVEHLTLKFALFTNIKLSSLEVASE